MKSLLFDLLATQPNVSVKRHGGGKYGEVVFFRMAERNIPFSCFYDSRLWLNPKIEEVCHVKNIPLYDCHKISVGKIVREHNIESVYSALPLKWVLSVPEECEIYGTLHGLRALETPKDWYFMRYKKPICEAVRFLIGKIFSRACDRHRKWRYQELYFYSGMRFITVSEHSRMAIKTWFPEYKNDVKCFYSPNTSREVADASDVEHTHGADHYLLLVSGNRWEKNNLRAIMAFDRLVSNKQVDDSLRMKVTGCSRNDFKYKIKNKERYDFLGYVEETELDRLYADAYLFVYPTLNEGFGYPPLEAMRHKVPVIASPFSSVSEICGGGVLYFNPFSIEEIMNRILMMTNPLTHEEYAQRGFKQYLYIKERQDRDLDALIDYLITDNEC